MPLEPGLHEFLGFLGNVSIEAALEFVDLPVGEGAAARQREGRPLGMEDTIDVGVTFADAVGVARDAVPLILPLVDEIGGARDRLVITIDHYAESDSDP